MRRLWGARGGMICGVTADVKPRDMIPAFDSFLLRELAEMAELSPTSAFHALHQRDMRVSFDYEPRGEALEISSLHVLPMIGRYSQLIGKVRGRLIGKYLSG